MTAFNHANGASARRANVPAFGAPFSLFGNDFDQVFGPLFGRNRAPQAEQTEGDAPVAVLTPRIDVAETDDAIELTAELPGVEESDVDVSVLEGVLTLSGEKKSTRESNDGVRVVERRYGSFKRSFRLADNIDAEKISATFKNGVLTLTLPKVPETKPEPRKIAING